MSNQPGPPGLDERTIEEGVRNLLDPLDRQLGPTSAGLGLAVIVGCPVLGVVLWIFWLPWYGALLLALVAVCLVVPGGIYLENKLVRRTLANFDRLFPRGSPQREVALRLLDEMESPNKAEVKLREMLQSESPDRIVRRRGAPSAEQQIDAALDALESDSPPPPLPPPPPVASPPTVKPGGYYDYIPLEPRQAEDDKTP